MDDPVAVIGGGWAGCSAAIELARRGHRVALYEAAPVLGGRARRVLRDGLPLDNGQHLLLGAYSRTLAIADALRGDADGPAWSTSALSMRPLTDTQRNALRLTARALPAPFGLALGVLTASGLTLIERLATLRWFARLRRDRFQVLPDATVGALLAALPRRAREHLWEPLCLAALNTPPAQASARVFANVLRAAFDADATAARVVAARVDLADALPEPAARWLRARGHAVHTAATARIGAIGPEGIGVVVRGTPSRVRAAIVAVGPHQLQGAFAPAIADANPAIAAALHQTRRLRYEPITTIYLGYPAAHRLPRGLLRLDDAPGQWVFDRSDIVARAGVTGPAALPRTLYAVVISASGPHGKLGHPALVAAVDAQLRRGSPGLPALCWSQVIVEKRATYACVPGLALPRCGRLAGGVYLAGDYTYDEFPATLEAAVASGMAAAGELADDLSRDCAAASAARDSIHAP
ncbi:MAG TPA: hydroxysqualene dehydroxylase HpnE [Casimicrobiaceae bacterium]|nr:hydroxysqualene dehydroxylase HpnE [Casimicrobiaceae bacterium]